MPGQATNTTSKRLRILGDDEIEAIYARPHFTQEERIHYFALTPVEKAMLEQLHSINSRIYWILQLGYFKAKQLFFTFELYEVEEDARYIQEQYYPNFRLTQLEVTKVTRLKQRNMILDLCHFRLCAAEERQQLEARARQTAMISSKPVYVFRELMQYLADQRIVAPGYSLLQDTVGQALNYEQNRLSDLVQTHLQDPECEALRRLLEDSPGLYEITLLKREPKDLGAFKSG